MLLVSSNASYSTVPDIEHASARDINSYTKEKTTIEPTSVFRGHTSVVGVSLPLFMHTLASFSLFTQDVDWNSAQDYAFASVGDDKMLMLYVSLLISHRTLS